MGNGYSKAIMDGTRCESMPVALCGNISIDYRVSSGKPKSFAGGFSNFPPHLIPFPTFNRNVWLASMPVLAREIGQETRQVGMSDFYRFPNYQLIIGF
jgi:hypothetical protein